MSKHVDNSAPAANATLQSLFDRSKALVSNARGYIGQFANAVTVYTSFELGRYIVEEEQQGKARADYGKRVLDSLSEYLTAEFGRGFSRANVAKMRQFYLAYQDRKGQIASSQIGQFASENAAGIVSTLSRQSDKGDRGSRIVPTELRQSENGNTPPIVQTQSAKLAETDSAGIVPTRLAQSGISSGTFPFPLSWSHYQILMRIENRAERDFYEREAIEGSWDVKTLKRQYGSSLYERLALSRDKNEVMRLAQEGATPQKPNDLIKNPFVLEFAGLADKAAYHESDLETAVVNHLQDFLLEMGKGFLFEARQKRFSFDCATTTWT